MTDFVRNGKATQRLYKASVQKLIKQVPIPVQLPKQALERMKVEERQLHSDPTM